MKSFMLLTAVLFGANAFAQSTYQFCNEEMTFRSSKRECRRVVDGGDFERQALRFCLNEFASDDDKIDCLQQIKNESFDQYALLACEEMSFRSNKMECLGIISERDYSFSDSTYCADQFRDYDIADCLLSTGRLRRSPRRNQTIITETVYDHNEFTTCYERPRTRLVEYRDERQARQGRNAVIGGLVGIGIGQIIGGDTGDVVSAIGAGVAIYGAIEVADSREIIYQDNGYDCRSYYTTDTRTYTRVVNNRRCTTTRYYTNRWGSTHEYFETTCGSSRYMSFERSSDIWYAD